MRPEVEGEPHRPAVALTKERLDVLSEADRLVGGQNNPLSLSSHGETTTHVRSLLASLCYTGSASRASLGRAWTSWLRELMSSFVKTLCRWYSTVRGLMKRRAPISGFESPSRASRAI
jgi:hypothetical protein